MTPYFILLFVIVALSSSAQKFKKIDFLRNLFVFIYVFYLIIFAGIRHFLVGADTSTYVNRFLGNKPLLENIMNNSSSLEIGYQFIEWIAFYFSHNYISLLIIVASVVVIFQIKSIYSISISPTISIFVLITFGFYTFSFNGMRQGIAIAIYLYALKYVVSGNFKQYVLFVLFAFLFHKTVIIMLPLYYIFRLQFNLKLLFAFTISTAFLVLFFDSILDLSLYISNKYAVYKEMEASGGSLLTISYLLLSFFFIIVRKLLNPQLLKYYDIFLNMFLIGTIIYIVVQITGAYIEITRIAAYFLASIIFLWPMVIKGINKDLRFPVFVLFIISSLLFYIVYLSKIGNLIPYKINELF